MARRNQDIVKKNSKLESFLQRSLTAETHDRVRGYESCVCVSEKENKTFKYVVLSDEWIYLTENPPKSIRGVVHLRDVVNVELVNDYPDFLSGDEQKNAQHITITHITTEPPRKRSLRRLHHRSPRNSVTDLQNADRSNCSTPLGYISSIDGSEDVGYFTQSMTSLPHSRPTSRGSIGSQREGRSNMAKKKKKPLAINESWEQDSILRSLKEEKEEDTQEGIENSDLMNGQEIHSGKLPPLQSSQDQLSVKSLNYSGINRLNASQTSIHPFSTSQTSIQSLFPHPKNSSIKTEVSSQEVKADNAGVVLTPVHVTTKRFGCLCLPFLCGGNKSQVSTVHQNGINNNAVVFSSKTAVKGGSKNGIPSVAINTLADDGRESCCSNQSSAMGGTRLGAGSRSVTPSLDTGSLLPSELNGSVSGLMDPNAPDQRQTILHIYLLNPSSPMIMLLRGAWNNYLIRATLSLDPSQNPRETNSVLLRTKNQREKCELFMSQLKQRMFEPSNSLDIYFQLFNDLNRAIEGNFFMKRLFWRSADILAVMVQQIQTYMPDTNANIHTEDGRAQRVDELEYVILLVKTVSLMFRESEILSSRMHTLKTQRGKYIIDLLMTLTAALNMPEKQILLMKHWSAPSKNTRFGSNTTLNRDAELYQLLSEYICVSISAVFELFQMAKQNQVEQDSGADFTVSWMVKVLKECRNIEHFVERVMSQVLEMINLARFGAVSSEQAVQLYQQFSLLLAVLEHSSSILLFLRKHYHEEFKYFIQGPALARKLPSHFPITGITLRVVHEVSSKILGHPAAKGLLTPR